MDEQHYDGDYAQEDTFEGDALIQLGIRPKRASEIKRIRVVRPSGSTIIQMKADWAITLDVRKPIADGLPWTLDVWKVTQETGRTVSVAEGHPIDPVLRMPDGEVINLALDLMLDWFRKESARLRQQRLALRLLDWIGRYGPSDELVKLVEDDRVSFSCELSESDVIYRLEVWAGPKSGLDPAELFAG